MQQYVCATCSSYMMRVHARMCVCVHDVRRILSTCLLWYTTNSRQFRLDWHQFSISFSFVYFVLCAIVRKICLSQSMIFFFFFLSVAHSTRFSFHIRRKCEILFPSFSPLLLMALRQPWLPRAQFNMHTHTHAYPRMCV